MSGTSFFPRHLWSWERTKLQATLTEVTCNQRKLKAKFLLCTHLGRIELWEELKECWERRVHNICQTFWQGIFNILNILLGIEDDFANGMEALDKFQEETQGFGSGLELMKGHQRDFLQAPEAVSSGISNSLPDLGCNWEGRVSMNFCSRILTSFVIEGWLCVSYPSELLGSLKILISLVIVNRGWIEYHW